MFAWEMVSVIPKIDRKRCSYVARQQGVNGKSSPFSVIVGSQDNKDIFDADDQCQSPDDQGQGPK